MFEGLTFKVAEGAERLRTLELRRKIYEHEFGYHGTDQFDDAAYHLVAVDSDNGEILSGLRIMGPEQRPFEIEQYIDLSDIVDPIRLPAQVGGFWVQPEQRLTTRHTFLPIAMLRFAYGFCRERGITDLIMRTHIVRLRDFYRRGFFRLLENLSFEHPAWGEVFVMHLDFLDLEASHSQSKDPVARFLLAKHNPSI